MSRSQGARLPSLPLVTFLLLVAGLTTLVRDRNDDRHALWRVQGAAEPTLVSPSMLLALRCAFAAVLAAVTAYDLCLDPGFELNTEQRSHFQPRSIVGVETEDARATAAAAA